MHRTISVALLAIACAATAHAQSSAWRAGASLGGALAVPSADFRELPGAPSCLREEGRLAPDGGGLLTIGGELGWRAPGSSIELSTSLGIALGSQRFAAEERIGEASDATGTRRDLIVEYRSAVERLEIRLEPSVRWHPARPFVLSAGVLAALPLRTTFEQSERLVAPSQATYADGSTERANASGSLDGAAWVGLTASVGVELATGGGPIVRPELGGVLALASPVAGVDWRAHELRAGVAVIFGASAESTPITPSPRDTRE